MEKLNEVSQKVFNTIINNKLVPGATLEHFSWLKSNKDKLIKIAMSKGSIYTQRNWLLAIAKMMKLMGYDEESKPFYAKVVELNNKVTNNDKNQKLTDKRVEEFVDYSTIVKKRDQLGRLYKKDPTNKLINIQNLLLNLYTRIPPLRNDYSDCKIIDNADNDNGADNYLFKTGSKYTFILNHDKVSHLYGKCKIPLPTYLNKLIIDSIKNYPRSKLLDDYTKSNISNILKEIFTDKCLCIDNLRNAYITDFYKKNKTLKQKEKLAKDMRHSKNTAELSYNKILNSKDQKKMNIKRLKPIQEIGEIIKKRPNRGIATEKKKMRDKIYYMKKKFDKMIK